MLSHLLHAVAGDDNGNKKMKPQKIKGTVILMKKNVLDFNDFHASFLDGFHELLGKGVSFQLISSQLVDDGEFFISFCFIQEAEKLYYCFIKPYLLFCLLKSKQKPATAINS